jgi:hypothetical protein
MIGQRRPNATSSEDHDESCPSRRLQRERRANEKLEKADEAQRKNSTGDEGSIDSLHVARMVGELVKAVEDLLDGKAERKAELLEAMSKQLQEVAKLAGEDGELKTECLSEP